MTFNYNHITIIGKAIDLTAVEFGGDLKATLVLKVDRNEEEKNLADNITCILWGQLAENALAKIEKDDPILIEGSLNITKSGAEVQTENFQLLKTKNIHL